MAQTLLGLSTGLFCACLAVAQSAKQTWTQDETFEAYRVVIDRNIFDPNRRQKREGPPPPAPAAAPAPAREHIDLTGVLLSAEATVAFFEGSREEYAKVLKAGDTIAGHTLTGINSDRVVFAKGEGTFELPVGGRLKQTGDEEWQVQEREGALGTQVSLGSGDSTSTTGSSGSDSTSSSGSDLLKRMLERRKKELAK